MLFEIYQNESIQIQFRNSQKDFFKIVFYTWKKNWKNETKHQKNESEKSTFVYNGSHLKDPAISGAIFTFRLSILILNSQCVEGARDIRVL